MDRHPARSPAGRMWAWGATALFGLSLAYFLFAYTVTFAAPVSGPVRLRDLAWNAGLFAAFGLHHSIFARIPVRRVVARLVPASLERSFYVAVASLLLILVLMFWRAIPGLAWHVDGIAAWAIRALQIAGLLLTIRSAAVIDVRELAGLSQTGPPSARPSTAGAGGAGYTAVDRTPSHPGEADLKVRRDTDGASADTGGADSGRPEPDFKTSGPYGWVRHPIYSGWFLIVFSVPAMTYTQLEWALISSAYVLAAIPFEEGTIRRTAGDAYNRYAQRVRWKLVPGVY